MALSNGDIVSICLQIEVLCFVLRLTSSTEKDGVEIELPLETQKTGW